MNKRNIIISIALIFFAIIYTVLVKNINAQEVNELFNATGDMTHGYDISIVQEAEATDNTIGFANINKPFSKMIGVRMNWYIITECIGYTAFLICAVYAMVGLIQLIKRKNILKVDNKILVLGVFYIIVGAVYLIFEKVIINNRPVLFDGILKASYPSSHTVMVLCVCISSMIINQRLLKSKKARSIIAIIESLFMIVMLFGRIISGVHWLTDIIGGMIISGALLMSFYTALNMIKEEK